MLANRIGWFFGLTGPSVNLDSACSSSMMAMDFACQALSSGDASMALVGGSNNGLPEAKPASIVFLPPCPRTNPPVAMPALPTTNLATAPAEPVVRANKIGVPAEGPNADWLLTGAINPACVIGRLETFFQSLLLVITSDDYEPDELELVPVYTQRNGILKNPPGRPCKVIKPAPAAPGLHYKHAWLRAYEPASPRYSLLHKDSTPEATEANLAPPRLTPKALYEHFYHTDSNASRILAIAIGRLHSGGDGSVSSATIESDAVDSPASNDVPINPTPAYRKKRKANLCLCWFFHGTTKSDLHSGLDADPSTPSPRLPPPPREPSLALTLPGSVEGSDFLCIPSVGASASVQNPLLSSIYAETLRLHVKSYFVASSPHADVALDRWWLPEGEIALVNSSISHMDERFWKETAPLIFAMLEVKDCHDYKGFINILQTIGTQNHKNSFRLEHTILSNSHDGPSGHHQDSRPVLHHLRLAQRRRLSKIHVLMDKVEKELNIERTAIAVGSSTSRGSSSWSEESDEDESDNNGSLASESDDDDVRAPVLHDEMSDDDTDPDKDLGEVDTLLDDLEDRMADDLGFESDDSRFDDDDPEANLKYSEGGGFVEVEDSEDDFADSEPSAILRRCYKRMFQRRRSGSQRFVFGGGG
ncbi:uncharacterized protein BDZ99DRAFT_500567 [Mytilinidion resinicola]|uniref:Beta-ketoacyl synthase-like N-terminal domain-containing protein n=1 Tax=Mytilinidion resinicola TaxID=574789 RepID=A0A6A6YH63_9PEZI|nr:uncharacterized protein BDZ99DRAFT_500567 [Mytilinidion resinicola]KAF2807344.1 hypothetical protein BDZ99DRAFT_500567 [Mytilinidion resinicola]